MSIKIPILINHEQNKNPIGVFEDGIVTLFEPLTYQQVYEIFGNIGFLKLDYCYDKNSKNPILKKFEIFEWSLTN